MVSRKHHCIPFSLRLGQTRMRVWELTVAQFWLAVLNNSHANTIAYSVYFTPESNENESATTWQSPELALLFLMLSLPTLWCVVFSLSLDETRAIVCVSPTILVNILKIFATRSCILCSSSVNQTSMRKDASWTQLTQYLVLSFVLSQHYRVFYVVQA